MDMEIIVAGRAKDLLPELQKVVNAVSDAVVTGEQFDVRLYGKDEDGSDMIVAFNNDDCERPEMDGRIIVTVDEQ